MAPKQFFKTIWISDVHLGTPGCRAEELKAFLQHVNVEKIVLVGDIVDAWALEKRWFWPKEHIEVVQEILYKVEHENVELIYVTGNHDDFIREHVLLHVPDEYELHIGNIRIVNEHIHVTGKNVKLWCVHGDHYDVVLKHYKAFEITGDFIYGVLLWFNNYYDFFRRKYKWRRFSLINFLKKKVRTVERFVKDFENTITAETNKRGWDGVVSGHIHKTMRKNINNVQYWNCGDWVESCTAIVEMSDGEIKIVEWIEDWDSAGNKKYILNFIDIDTISKE